MPQREVKPEARLPEARPVNLGETAIQKAVKSGRAMAGGIPVKTATNLEESERVSNRPKVGRNDPCPCGSGKKYKKCHYPQYG